MTTPDDTEGPEHAQGSTLTEKIGEYRKAIGAFIVPPLVALGAAVIPDADGVVRVTAAEWVAIILAAFATSAVVAGLRNDPLK